MNDEVLNPLLEVRAQSQRRWCAVIAAFINTDCLPSEPISETLVCSWFRETGLRVVHVNELADGEGEAEAIALAFLDSLEANHSSE